MRVAAAAVVADFARLDLVPRLRRVEDHAVLVERLKGPGDVGRHPDEEAGVRVAVGVNGLRFPRNFRTGTSPRMRIRSRAWL